MASDQPVTGSGARRRLLPVVLLLGITLTLASRCSPTDLANNVKEEHYDTHAEAPSRGDLAFVLPDFVPADATDITVRVYTEDPNTKMYNWTSATGQLPDNCTSADVTDTAAPFDPDSWPDQVLTAPGQVCAPRPVHIRIVDQHFYAW